MVNGKWEGRKGEREGTHHCLSYNYTTTCRKSRMLPKKPPKKAILPCTCTTCALQMDSRNTRAWETTYLLYTYNVLCMGSPSMTTNVAIVVLKHPGP